MLGIFCAGCHKEHQFGLDTTSYSTVLTLKYTSLNYRFQHCYTCNKNYGLLTEISNYLYEIQVKHSSEIIYGSNDGGKFIVLKFKS